MKGKGCLVLLEAMAAGLPAVAYDIPGVNELVKTEDTGQLVEVGQIDAFARALMELLADPTKAQNMGQNGRALVATHFNFQTLLDRLTARYSELASG